jgi:pyrroloquinoline quinone (PQQ) biosynthesis protein C
VLSGERSLDVEAFVTTAAEIDDADLLLDEDVQLSLWVLYELHYRGFGVDADLEWDPALLRVRRVLEDRLLDQLRRDTAHWVDSAASASGDLASRLFALTEDVPGAPLAAFMQRQATHEQFVEYLTHKSVYHLKESDPQSFVLARLTGPPKVALAELQYDEYGAGRPDRLHQNLFAEGMVAAGMDPEYGAYLDVVPASTLAVSNVMNLLVLRRSLAPAAMGHLGAFEATSSEPCRRIAGGCRRLGLPDAVASYFDEHVEADAVHEQLAFRNICAALAEDDPTVEEDILFGAAAYLYTEALAGQAMLDAWESRSTSLIGDDGLADNELDPVGVAS